MIGAADAWEQAQAAARLFALDPAGSGGIHLRARPGPVRDAFLAMLRGALLPETVWRTCPPGITDDRLLGGLDLPATLAGVGRPGGTRGLLAQAHGGVVVVPGAERIGPGLAARLAAALDQGVVRAERDGLSMLHPARFGLVLLDEGEDADVAAPLLDRVAFRVELDGIRAAPDGSGGECAHACMEDPACPVTVAETLCAAAMSLGIGSARAALFAARAARGSARLAGRDSVTEEDVSLAARLVLAHRATRLPADAPPPETEPAADTTPDDAGEAGEAGSAVAEVLAAVQAILPAKLLDDAGGSRGAGVGRSGKRPVPAPRGRPAGSRPGRPGGGARLHLLATLMAALPRQRLRRRSGAARIAVRAADLRIRVHVARPRQTTLFLVDASGSAALHRLAEAKGAVELLLGECYVGRNEVGLIAFRGQGAELLLPPTRALARARRCLGALPGGGGTPLAAGLQAATEMGARLRRRGGAPMLVLLTDGKANVALDGAPDRPRAMADAAAAAGRLRSAGLPILLLDIAPRPSREAAELAALMGARYLPLPQADAACLSRAVREVAA